MEEREFENVYKIDKARLSMYYERIKSQNKELLAIENITNFLVNQSIGSSFDEVFSTLKHFEEKIIEGKNLLDLAFEWIRAQKIRLEYKKYLIRAQYPNNNLSLAVDDCIYHFFLDYDNYIRKLFKTEVREHNFSALYDIFFSPFDKKGLMIEDIIERHIHIIPTHYYGSKKINTRIMTLREGLSNIIVKDYENVLFSRGVEEKTKKCEGQKQGEFDREITQEFNGTNIERIIKSYCFNKIEIKANAIEGSISNFLNSYFKFGKFYKIEEFKALMIQSLADYIYSGLTDNIKSDNSIEKIKKSISDSINRFVSIDQNKPLDGSAWTNDLKPILNKILKEFCDTLFK